jgi:hypothetical protein
MFEQAPLDKQATQNVCTTLREIAQANVGRVSHAVSEFSVQLTTFSPCLAT